MQRDYQYEVEKLLARKRTHISCIIPAYNEEKGIARVLNWVRYFPIFDEIIVVNDGSTDDTLKKAKSIENQSEKISVIDIKKNGGKTKAVIAGIKKAKGEIICLIDADLWGLKFEYLYKLLYFVLNGEFQMTILDRGGDRNSAFLGWFSSWNSRLWGGERAFWKSEFEKIKFATDSKYAIEYFMNIHYIKHEMKVRTIFAPDLSGTDQWNKKGLKEGLLVYARMFEELYMKSRHKTFFIQIENIVEDRLEPLYKLMDKAKYKKPVGSAIVAAGLLSSIVTLLWLSARKLIKRNK